MDPAALGLAWGWALLVFTLVTPTLFPSYLSWTLPLVG